MYFRRISTSKLVHDFVAVDVVRRGSTAVLLRYCRHSCQYFSCNGFTCGRNCSSSLTLWSLGFVPYPTGRVRMRSLASVVTLPGRTLSPATICESTKSSIRTDGQIGGVIPALCLGGSENKTLVSKKTAQRNIQNMYTYT